MNYHEIVELRRYTLVPGRREDLIDVFEREFLESQEACGMLPIGQYRDLDAPNLFVWFRGFPNIESRAPSLRAFYIESEAWRAHRDTANKTMIDSDNVLLLRPARSESGFDLDGLHRPGQTDLRAADSFVAVSILMLERAADEPLLQTFERDALPRLRAIAGRVGFYVTHPGPNDFPILPVREGEFAFVVFGICPTNDALDAWRVAFGEAALSERAEIRSVECLRLEPTPRALFR